MTKIPFAGSDVQQEREKPQPVNGAVGTFKHFWQGVKVEGDKKSYDGIPALFDFGGKPQVRYVLEANVGGKKCDYPGSFMLEELPAFAAAFGIKPNVVSTLPYETQPSSALLTLSTLIAKQGKTVTFSAEDPQKKGAWISRINEMSVPDGSYLVKVHSFTTRKNGKASWALYKSTYDGEEREEAKTFYLAEVVSGEYKGFRVKGSLVYPFQKDGNGNIFMAKTRAGVPTVASRRFSDFCIVTGAAKAAEDGALEFDFDFEDMDNFMPEIEKAVFAAGKICLAEVKKQWIQKEGLTPLPEGLTPQETSKPDANKLLIAHIAEKISPESVFLADGGYSASALEWLRANVKPICAAQRIPSNIAAMSASQIALILHELGDEERALQANPVAEVESSDF